MENVDREQILRMIESDIRLKRLYEEHERLERELGKYQKRPFLTQPEEMDEKDLKARKLRGVDKMMEILAEGRPVAA